MYRHFATGNTVQKWESLIIHIFTHISIYINLWTSVDLWSLSHGFSDPVSNVFLILLEIIFPMRDHTTILEKIDYLLIFCATCGVLVDCGTLENSAIKKKFVWKKLFLSTMATFGKCTRKMKNFCKVTPPRLVKIV